MTSRAPAYQPLVAIEYDGWLHRTDERKQYNDGLRNEIFKRAGLTLLRVSSDEVPPDEERASEAPRRLLLEAAIRCVAHARHEEEFDDDRKRLRMAIDRYNKLVIARAETGKVIRPNEDFWNRYLTSMEAARLTFLWDEYAMFDAWKEEFEILESSRDAWEVHDLNVTLTRVETGPGGSRAVVNCATVNGVRLGEVIGPRVSFSGTDDWYIEQAQRKVAIDEAFRRACTAYAATAKKKA